MKQLDGGAADAAGADADAAGECTPGDRSCDQNTPRACEDNGAWQRGLPCPNLCVAGGCAGICTPDARGAVYRIRRFKKRYPLGLSHRRTRQSNLRSKLVIPLVMPQPIELRIQ